MMTMITNDKYDNYIHIALTINMISKNLYLIYLVKKITLTDDLNR